MLNMSVWYMDIDTEVKFKANGKQQNIDTRIDPWVFSSVWATVSEAQTAGRQVFRPQRRGLKREIT